MADDWTREHSVATLLVGMSMIDDEVDAEEMRALLDVLRTFPGVDPGQAASIGQAAYKKLWEMDEDGDLIGTLREHAKMLAVEYEPSVLATLHAQLTRMADADGEVHPMERRLLDAFRSTWSLV